MIQQSTMTESIYTTDISGLSNINELYESSLIKKWIKLIPSDKTISFEDYSRKDHFIPIADIVLDTELCTTGKKQGNKKRNTLIQFIPTISAEAFNKKTEWLYLFVINGMYLRGCDTTELVYSFFFQIPETFMF